MADESILASQTQSQSQIGSIIGLNNNSVVPPANVDDGTYLFKFVAPGMKGKGTTHRFQARYDSFDFVMEIICGKLKGDTFFSSPSPTPFATDGSTTTMTTQDGGGANPQDFKICYNDDDGDLITMTADQDLLDAVTVARTQGKDRVVIILVGGDSWEKEMERRELILAAKIGRVPATVVVGSVLKAVEEEEEVVLQKEKGRKEKEADRLILGFLAKDQLLPASVALLAMAIVGVFTVSKVSSRT